MGETDTELTPDSFWSAVRRCSGSALRSGALRPISTHVNYIEDRGVEFVVRVSDNLLRKHSASATYHQPPDQNPFLPPDPQLTIGSLPPHHVAVLNKFNVLENHVLVVTRGFVHQECPLTSQDFAAVAPGLAAGNGLAFYNGGKMAGASQPHRHFQLVPLPLGRSRGFPMQVLFENVPPTAGRVRALSFRHAFSTLETDPREPASFGSTCHHVYKDALVELDLAESPDLGGNVRLPPYNLLLTPRWLFLAPRQTERYGGISINGLGYAGSLFVSTPAKLEQVREVGPMTILREVTMPWN